MRSDPFVPLRSILPPVARLAVVAMLAMQAAIAGPAHDRCAAVKHGCGATTRIAACCCLGSTEASRPAGPVVATVRVAPLTAAILAPPYRIAPPPALVLYPAEIPAGAPHGDLTILLSNLRI